MKSVAKDRILVRHQSLNKITKIQILGCKYFLLYSLNYLNIIIYLYSFICMLLFIFNSLFISYCIIIHPRICIFVILGKGLVSDEGASCAAGVICFLYTTESCQMIKLAAASMFCKLHEKTL